MEAIVRTRLNIISQAVEALISSGRDCLKNLSECKITVEDAHIIAKKLSLANERFVSETYNYFKLVQEPSADEVSSYTIKQMEAEELLAELEIRAPTIPNSNRIATSCVNSSNISARLPRMELARFNGDVLKWHQFWDQFSSNVDTRNISDVDKLLYLQSVLSGEAKQAIEGLDTTNKNYKIAVDTLKERYGKTSAIIDAHYVALYRTQAANNSITDCRRVLSEVERHLRVLKSLGEDVNHNHLRVMLMEKFPEDLIYELRIKMGDGNETIDNIRKNLEYIISARETSNRLKRDNDNKKQNIQSDNFTCDTFHAIAESSEINKGLPFKRIFHKARQDRNRNFDDRRMDGYYNRKRKHEDVNDQQNKRKKAIVLCIFCQNNHYNDECTKFKSLQERKFKLKGRCYNCLGKGHNISECKSKRECHHCGKFGLHNRALCPDKSEEPKADVSTKSFSANTSDSMTILQTATAKVFNVSDDHKQHMNCRILLDCGSQRSYVTDRVVKQLNLSTVEENRLSIFTFGTQDPKIIDSPIVHLKLVTHTNKCRIIHANVVPYITKSVTCPYGKIPNPDKFLKDGMTLADDGSRKDQVDILLGNDYYFSFVSNTKTEYGPDLFLVQTEFGGVWSGRCPTPVDTQDKISVLTYFQSSKVMENHFCEPDLPLQNDNLKQLWDLESIGIVDSPKCSRDEDAIKQFNDTTEYTDYRYYVKWPWVEYPPTTLPVSYGLALGRLTSLFKRLNSDTLQAYSDVLKDQLEKGIIEVVEDTRLQVDHPVHYLPHHYVLQEGKTTKLRVVVDASAKIKDNNSLNECLYRGPLLLEDLTALLIRFREHKIGIVADVEKAFLQVGLQLPDRDVTRFLWLKNIHQGVSPNNIQHLRFCRVPFGIISSPFLLNAVIKHHLTKSNDDTKINISEDIYVDNLVTGTDSVEEAVILYNVTKKSFNEISMNIRQWNSNSDTFMNQVPNDVQDTAKDSIKVLGVEWNIKTDELRLSPKHNSHKEVLTKRGILKVCASIYDPCGFVAPIVLPAKLLIQDLWKYKVKWDDIIPKQFCDTWTSIRTDLARIKEVTIPRMYANASTDSIQNPNNIEYELHAFADASKQAYAAVVYLRGYDIQNKTFVSFVMGKSRLAPIKNQKDLQIPRLELLAAVIGNRLLCYIMKSLRIQIQNQFLWVDSEIVISWYNSTKLLPPFVARRVSEIKSNKRLTVRYVPTDLNPADTATRTCNALKNIEFWLSGPNFLKANPNGWPVTSAKKKDNVHTHISSNAGKDLTESNDDNKKSTDDGKEVVVIFEKTTRQEKAKDIDEEMEIDLETQIESDKEDKEITRILKLQQEHFSKEYEGKQTNLLKSFRLFKDDKGLLRCGGRFQNADWSENKKYPILLPKNTKITSEIIEKVHKQNYHVGVSHTLDLVRQEFWIIQGRSQVQKVLRNCLQCRKYNGGPYKLPPMPPLPAERVRYSSPFTFTGLDYFGPLKIEEDSVEKRWVCLFTCLCVRAIHMEIVKDLSADECVMAIRRFVAIRGLPQVLISDNATQFKLTAEVLTSDYCIKNKISWRFIPELAPWFGGFYERLIGLVKGCLKKTIDKHLLNHNQLCTIIKEVEAVVNTRPLTTVGDEFEHVLTPADFLRIGGPVVTDISEEVFLEQTTITKDKLIEIWKRGQDILKDYQRMFTTQYLDSLRERRSVHKQSRVVVDRVPKKGEIVQIKSDQNRTLWKIGRISAVITGSDRKIRVARVTLPSGEVFTRSISHLYPLEMEDESNETRHKDKKKEVSNSDAFIEKDDTNTDASGIKLTQKSPEPECNEEIQTQRTKRLSAQRAQSLVKQWTKELIKLV